MLEWNAKLYSRCCTRNSRLAPRRTRLGRPQAKAAPAAEYEDEPHTNQYPSQQPRSAVICKCGDSCTAVAGYRFRHYYWRRLWDTGQFLCQSFEQRAQLAAAHGIMAAIFLALESFRSIQDCAEFIHRLLESAKPMTYNRLS